MISLCAQNVPQHCSGRYQDTSYVQIDKGELKDFISKKKAERGGRALERRGPRFFYVDEDGGAEESKSYEAEDPTRVP